MFFFKNISKSTWIGLKEDIYVVSMPPAFENTLSRGTEVAGIPTINNNTVKKCGY